MLKTNIRRLAFFLYIGIVVLIIFGLMAYKGIDSPWPWMWISLFALVPLLYMRLFQIPYIVWKESYSVGVAEIDYDHKKLLELINRVVSATSYKLGDDFSQEIFRKLIDYTKYHFDREEKLMEKYGYPDRENHAIQHNKFIATISDIYSQFGNNNKIAHQEIYDFLKNWLLKHIAKSDKKLGAFIKAKRSNASD